MLYWTGPLTIEMTSYNLNICCNVEGNTYPATTNYCSCMFQKYSVSLCGEYNVNCKYHPNGKTKRI